MTVNYQFPKDFWWGSATSAPQIEGSANGKKGDDIWDYWYKTEPNRFFDGVGPDQTSDFFNHYKQDIQNMKAIGHNSFRMSISWARLIPDGIGEINQEAVQFYNRVIDELITNGIEPFVNLFHFDMPLQLQKIGGWENRKVIDAYAGYAKKAFDLFGDRIKTWFTFNEPIVPVENGYLYDAHYPNIVSFKKAIQVAYHTTLAHAKAVQIYHRSHRGKIGIILNLTPSYPRSQHPADLKAAQICDLLFNRSFLDPVIKGSYPKDLIKLLSEYELLPDTLANDQELIKQNKIDLIGINYYQPRRVKAKESLPNPNSPIMPDWFFDLYEMPGRKMNPYRGWEIYEQGIYDIMIDLKENYHNIESFISENGMGVQNEERFLENGTINDTYRINFIKGHLKYLHKAIQEGCNVKGYHLWTFMDNWSWMNAYKNRYGFYSVNLKTQERTAKKSAHWFAQVSRQNGFND